MAGAWGKLGEMFMSEFSLFFGDFFYRPIRFVDLIEINNENVTPFK